MNRPALLTVTIGAVLASACSSPTETPAAPVPPPAAETVAEPVVPTASASAVDPVLDAYIRDYAKDAMPPLRYAAATHGEGDQKLTFAYLIGPEYCGSAGCSLMILHRRGDAFDLLGKISTVYTPVRVLPSMTNGRPDLAIRTRGEGISTVDKLIPFNGHRYAWSPNLPAARDVANPGGEIILTDDTPKVTVRE
jgi:hypothetical protein